MRARPWIAACLVLVLVPGALAALLAGPAAAGPPVPNAAEAPTAVYAVDDPFNYSDTILLGNNNSQTSRNLTLYFQAQRGVPDANVLFADLPPGETISEAQWNTFAAWFVNETANRSLGSQVNYIVTFKDMPIRVSWSHAGNNGPTSFQDELMLLGGSYEAYIGQANLYGNPYYNQTDRFSFAKYGIRLVTGIYAYNESTARALIDRASGSLGNRGEYVLDTDWSRGYANSSGATARGSYQYANSALVWADGILRARGEPSYLDYNNTYVTDRTGVMGYASWGSNDCCDGGVTTHSLPRNQWVNGSIAETFVSTGGRTFTWPPSYGQSLIADWVDEGVSGIKGYVNEPYIIATAEGHILFNRYTRGYNLADSFWSASYVMGWRQIVIGDPKMAPYADVGDLSFNASLTTADEAVDQNTSFNLTVAVNNSAALPRDVDLRVLLPDGSAQDHVLALLGNHVSVFQLQVDVSGLPPAIWGVQTFTLVLDPGGAVREWDEANNTWTFPVDVRRPPVVVGSLDLSTVHTFEATTLRVNATVADRPIVRFQVRVDGGPWQELNASGGESSLTVAFNRSGVHLFEVRGTDSAGLDSQVVGVGPLTVLNRPPTAVANVNTTTPLSGEPVAFSASGSGDADGSVVAFGWVIETVGRWNDSDFEVVFDHPGSFVVNLTVADDEGAVANATLVVEVQNRPPRAVAEPNATEAFSGVPFLVDASASLDPDGLIVSYTFAFDGALEASGTQAQANHTFTTPGLTGVWVTVTDDWGATDRVRITLLVLDRAPDVSWSLGLTENVTEGGGVSADVEVQDPDSSLFSYAVDWGDGTKDDFVLSGRQTTFTLAHSYDFEGQYTILLTVADVEGNFTSLTSTVSVEHPAPAANTFIFSAAGGNLSVTYDIESPFPETVTVVVFVDDVAWRTFPAPGAGSVDLATEGLAPGNHSLRFEVTDGVKNTLAGTGTLTIEEPVVAPPPDGGGSGGAEPTGGGLDALVIGAALLLAVAFVAGLLLWRRRQPPEGVTEREGT